ncbi:hypothetical protein EBF04_08895 [Streptomyces sp. I6]|nr:hypothetical protein EBF04_08895 [Streptomyces sp. I6]
MALRPCVAGDRGRGGEVGDDGVGTGAEVPVVRRGGVAEGDRIGTPAQFRGRYRFSARKVYAPPGSPGAREPGSPVARASARSVDGGTTQDVSGPIHRVHAAISRSPAGVAICA